MYLHQLVLDLGGFIKAKLIIAQLERRSTLVIQVCFLDVMVVLHDLHHHRSPIRFKPSLLPAHIFNLHFFVLNPNTFV